MTDLNLINAVTYYKMASSVDRASVRFIKLEVAGSNLNVSFLFFSFFFFSLFVLNYYHSRLLQGGL